MSRVQPFFYEGSYRVARLVAAARRGDKSAFDALLLHFDRPLRAFLASRLPADAIDDVLQETCIACWLGLPAYHGRSRFQVWLFGIAHHKSLDHLRAHARSREVSFDDFPSEEAATATATYTARDPFREADLRLDSRRLLARLPEAQREVMELYYYADLTLDEVAQALGRSAGTVKSQFYRGHERAITLLQQEGLLPDAATGTTRLEPAP